MKKLFTLFLALFSMTIVKADETNGFVEVTSALELKEVIQKDPYAKIHLAADIKLAQFGNDPYWDTFLEPFYGTIDGGNTFVNQLTGEVEYLTARIYGTNRDQWKWTNRCLFSTLENAVLSNLTFMNLSVEEFANNKTGLIAREAKNCIFSNVTMCNVKVTSGVDIVGTLVGYAEDCRFFAVSIQNSEVETDGKRAGALVGQSKNCGYQMCFSNPATRVYSDGTAFDGAYAGGLVGHSQNDVFTSCINTGMIGANDHYVGGLAGMSEYSQFYSSLNCGPVAHLDITSFGNAADDQRAMITKQTADKVQPIVMSTLGESLTVEGKTISAEMISDMVSEFCRESLNSFLQTFSGGILGKFDKLNICTLDATDPGQALAFGRKVPVASDGKVEIDPCVKTLCSAFWPIGVVFSNGLCAKVAAFNILEHDNVGGLTGWAKGGLYERCSNYGTFATEDENCGGIVGLGQGVTINNCFNGEKSTDYDVASTTAGILGKAEPDESKGNKKCLVTNCLSTWNFHIVGNNDYSDGIDPASGNNYRLEGGDCTAVDCEMQLNQSQLASGLVAMWLNQGIQNRLTGVRPWRQDIVAEILTLRDECPVLDVTHPEVTVFELPHDVITMPEQLLAFAQKVNEGNQFACAVLDADIDMTDQPWTPIGKVEDNRYFRGIFDGCDHTISGLKCNSNKAVGMFGAVHVGAEISNVIISEDCEFTGTANEGAGAIVGMVPIDWSWGNVVIENCGNLGQITATNTVNAGGILGLVKNTTPDGIKVYVDHCWNLGTVTAENGNSALLCGYMRNSGVVTNCWSGGKLKTSTSAKPFDDTQKRTECFVGYFQKLEIKDCSIAYPAASIDLYGEYPLQDGVEILSDEFVRNGEFAYELNGGVVDGTQMWYQKIGTDPLPVRTKLSDGTNMVLPYENIEGNFGGVANTSCEEIADVITGIKRYSDHKVVDFDKTRKVDVIDLVKFIEAANK